MHCVLVLQLPTPDLKYGHVITASTNPALLRQFCETVLSDQARRVEESEDLFQREFQQIRLDQLRVKLAWATGSELPSADDRNGH